MDRIDKSNQGQGIFTSDTTSGDYTGIYLADDGMNWEISFIVNFVVI
ncbi:MAG: hypothetical protein K2J46_11105 [Muribaculaceae bacterium]|nr:hypothetical protein [Muribaculaceae bacterium]